MAHIVTCIYCHKKFDRDKNEFVQVSQRRYAHLACTQSDNERLIQEEKDRENLYAYVCKLFNCTHVDARVQKQIKQYKEEYEYTYSGMQKALTYFYEVKANDISKANGGIGIVPYVYKQAFNYYYALWQANQRNEDKVIEEYKPNVKEIIIRNPERKIKKRPLFTFLDEEEEENGK